MLESKKNYEKSILLIDDDNEICDLLRMTLTLEKYNIVSSNSGMEGLELFRNKNFDLVLLDISLPDISGQQLCKIIRDESDIPIIMVSANDSVSDKVICLEYGADDYISKPFENLEIIARIKAVLRRFDKEKEIVYVPSKVEAEVVDDNSQVSTYFGYRVNSSLRIVTRENGDVINLTPKEFDLLNYFFSHCGETIDRDKIVEDLWGKNTLYKWSRSLDVHVQNLRQKIEKNPKNPSIIQTVSGVGYKIAKQKTEKN